MDDNILLTRPIRPRTSRKQNGHQAKPREPAQSLHCYPSHFSRSATNFRVVSRGTYAIIPELNIIEIENEIRKLPANKLDELVAWVGNYQAELWEKQIANDLDSGRLESLLDEVDEEIEARTLIL